MTMGAPTHSSAMARASSSKTRTSIATRAGRRGRGTARQALRLRRREELQYACQFIDEVNKLNVRHRHIFRSQAWQGSIGFCILKFTQRVG